MQISANRLDTIYPSDIERSLGSELIGNSLAPPYSPKPLDEQDLAVFLKWTHFTSELLLANLDTNQCNQLLDFLIDNNISPINFHHILVHSNYLVSEGMPHFIQNLDYFSYADVMFTGNLSDDAVSAMDFSGITFGEITFDAKVSEEGFIKFIKSLEGSTISELVISEQIITAEFVKQMGETLSAANIDSLIISDCTYAENAFDDFDLTNLNELGMMVDSGTQLESLSHALQDPQTNLKDLSLFDIKDDALKYLSLQDANIETLWLGGYAEGSLSHLQLQDSNVKFISIGEGEDSFANLHLQGTNVETLYFNFYNGDISFADLKLQSTHVTTLKFYDCGITEENFLGLDLKGTQVKELHFHDCWGPVGSDNIIKNIIPGTSVEYVSFNYEIHEKLKTNSLNLSDVLNDESLRFETDFHTSVQAPAEQSISPIINMPLPEVCEVNVGLI